jgi:CubicO group peptidase (beta-lactamase class C family)
MRPVNHAAALALSVFLGAACRTSSPTTKDAGPTPAADLAPGLRPATDLAPGLRPATDLAPGLRPATDLGARIDAFVAGFGAVWGAAHAAHGIIAVARGGDVVFSRAYGMAASLDTRFAIGSVTKPLTAACVLRLADQGKLSLDDRVRKWLPELSMADADRLTLRHLVTHTSGIKSYTDDPVLMRDRTKPRTPNDVVARLRASPLAFPPGAQFAYSNSNYYLLGLVVERATGEPYEAALGHQVLSPAQMTRTTMTGPREDDADGFTVDADERLVPVKAPHPGLTFAASGLRSTARDLLQLDRALAGDLLSDRARNEMETPHKGSYGCGWECWREAGVEITSHEGAIDGFSAFFARAPEPHVAVVVLLATDAFSGDRLTAATIGEPVLAMAIGERAVPPPRETPPVQADPAQARTLTGTYTLERVDAAPDAEPLRARAVPAPPRLVVSLDGERVFLAPEGEPKVRLFASADGALFPKQLGVRITASDDDHVTLDRFGRKMHYVRVARSSGR